MQSNPTRVSTHHFQYHHAVMRLRRGVQPIERFSSYVQGCHKAESQLRAGKIVVDGFRNADNRAPKAVKLGCNSECAFPTQDNQSLDPQTLEICDRFPIDSFRLGNCAVNASLDEFSAIARSQHGTAPRQQAADVGRR